MKMKKLNQQGIAGTLIILILVLVLAVGGIGYYVWNANKNTESTLNNTANSQGEPQKATKKTAPTTQQVQTKTAQTPQDFTKIILDTVSTNDNTKLQQYLTADFKAFRQKDLAKAPCNGKTTNPNYPSEKLLALVCASILRPAKLSSVTPTVTDYTFKNGSKGKSVDYEVANEGEPGTNYFSFKLVANKDSWLLSDYIDIFASKGDKKPDLTGLREAGN